MTEIKWSANIVKRIQEMTDQGILARKQIEAALKLCTVLLYASGYKPEKSLQHYRTIQALPWATSSRLKKMGASK